MYVEQGWEDTIVKQEDSAEHSSEMKISLPSMSSLYITSYLYQACEEIHRVGGHVLDKPILQNFASRLLEKVFLLLRIQFIAFAFTEVLWLCFTVSESSFK